MIEIGIVRLICAMLASAMAGATFGFLLCAILANSKRMDMQADETFRKLG